MSLRNTASLLVLLLPPLPQNGRGVYAVPADHESSLDWIGLRDPVSDKSSIRSQSSRLQPMSFASSPRVQCHTLVVEGVFQIAGTVKATTRY